MKTRRALGTRVRENAERLWVEVDTAHVDALGFVRQQHMKAGKGGQHVLFVPSAAPPAGYGAAEVVLGRKRRGR
jgi:hypothetical protein